MKLLHLAIIVILTSGLVIYNNAYADNEAASYGGLVRSHQTMASESMIQLLTGKHTYVPGEKIQIIGAFNPNDLIHVDLVNPADGTKNSTLLQSDNTGHFRTNYIVPYNAVNGTWKILATSGVNHASLDIQVISSNSGINGNTTHNYGTNSLAIVKMPSPLQQFKSGIATKDVKCKKGLQFIMKKENDQSACVTLGTAYNLMKRGWAASESVYPGNNSQFALYTNSTIIPGHLPRTGVKIPYSESSQIRNYSGFAGVYNTTLMYSGMLQDYVLEPGNTGTITFEIKAQVLEQPGETDNTPLPKFLNLTNYVVFYHEVTSIKELAKYPGTTIDGYDFKACSTGPAGGGACIGGESDGKNPIEAYVTDHPGVNVLLEPPVESLSLGSSMTSQAVTMTISADGDAPKGTYLVIFSPFGQRFLFTVGNQPYHE